MDSEQVQTLMKEIYIRSLSHIDQKSHYMIDCLTKKLEKHRQEFIKYNKAHIYFKQRQFNKQIGFIKLVTDHDLPQFLTSLNDQLKSKFEKLDQFQKNTDEYKLNPNFEVDPILTLPEANQRQDFKHDQQLEMFVNNEFIDDPVEKEIFICHICQQEFKFPSPFRKHYLHYHNLKKLEKCPHCEYKAKHPVHLARHLYQTHSEEYKGRQKMYKCKFTGKLMYRLSTLVEHVKHNENYTFYIPVNNCE